MSGCDGRHKTREYYTEVAQALPKDTIILTSGCAKYRYNKLDLGDIDGIPRVLDAGQCNDSYSLIIIAQKLAEAFGLTDINELPLSFNIAWYEQKAIAILLALVHMGVKNIRRGPTLPGFLTPKMINVMVEIFNVKTIGEASEDIEAMLSGN
jgi:hydroxylamine reductase